MFNLPAISGDWSIEKMSNIKKKSSPTVIFKWSIWAVTFRLTCTWLLFRCGLFNVYFEVIEVIAIKSEEIFNTKFEKAALRSLPWPTGWWNQNLSMIRNLAQYVFALCFFLLNLHTLHTISKYYNIWQSLRTTRAWGELISLVCKLFIWQTVLSEYVCYSDVW